MVQSFLLLGQSNMAGRGLLRDVEPIVNERILMLRCGRWQMMAEPINCDRPVAGVGPGASFADAWCHANEGGRIGLIPCAEGGSTLDEWAVGGTLYDHAVSEARFAMRDSRLSGILWHQGESDSHSGRHKAHGHKLRQILQGLRRDLDAPHIPILIGGLPDFLGKFGFGAACTEYASINSVLLQCAREAENCYFVDAAGLTPGPDGIHIDAVSQRRFGLRYFAALQRRQHILEPLPGEAETLALHQARAHTSTERLYLSSLALVLGELSWAEFEARLAREQA